MGYRALLLGLLVLSVGYVVGARGIPMDAWTAAETVNTRTLPILYGLLLALVLLILMVGRPGAAALPGGYRALRLAGLCAGVLCFTLIIAWLNFWVALGALLLGSAWWLGERRAAPLAGLAVAVPLIGYLGVELALGVYLPG
jgi:hypothetical protein